VSEEGNKSSLDIDSIDTSMLLDIDVSSASALPIDTLEKISWDLVATDTLGIMDPIGQLRAGLEGLLSGFVDTIKKAFEAIASPIKSVVDRIWSTLSTIPSVLSDIVNTLRSVVVKPIQDALNWVSANFSAVVDAVRTSITMVYRFLSDLPARVSEFIDNVRRFFGDLADRIRSGFAWFVEQVAKLPDAIRSLVDSVSRLFSELVDRVRSGFAWLVEQLGRVPDVVRGLVDSVARVFSDLAERVRSGFAWLIEQIGKLPDVVRGLLDTLSRVFGDIADRIRSGFAWFVEQVAKLPDFVKGLIDAASRLFGELVDKVRSGFSWFIEQITKIPDMIRGFIDTVSRLFGDIADRIRSGFAWFVEQVAKLPDAIRSLVDSVARVFSDLAERVRSGFAWFIEQVSRIPDIVRDWVSRVYDLFRDLVDRVRPVFTWLTEQIAKVPDVVRGLADAVARVFGELVEKVRSGFVWFIEQVSKMPDIIGRVVTSVVGMVAEGIGGVVGWIRSGFETLGKSLGDWFAKARDWFESATKTLRAVATALEVGFQGFVNVFMQLPQYLQNVFGGIVKFFEELWTGFQKFLRDPAGALAELGRWILEGIRKVAERVWEGLKWLWDAIQGFFMWIVSGLRWIGERIIEAFKEFSQWLSNMIGGFVLALTKAAKETASKIAEDILKVTFELPKNIVDSMVGAFSGVISSTKEMLGIHSPEFLGQGFIEKQIYKTMLSSIILLKGWLSITIMGYGLGYIVRGAGMAIGNLIKELTVSLKPGGVGGELAIRLGGALGATMSTLGNVLQSLGDSLAKGIIAGVSLWLARPFSKMVAAGLRDILPIEFPTTGEIVEFAKRTLGHKERAEFTEAMYWFLSLYGYSDYVVKRILGISPSKSFEVPGTVPVMDITDRFNAIRKIPLSISYEIPSHTELVRMVVRDIVEMPEEITKLLSVKGLVPDVAALFYLLHFRYPTPEKLADFYWRGISGVLWLEQTFEEAAVREFLGITWQAEPPKKLNFNAKTFNEMLHKYMKWHDYFPAAWSKGFPTDKSIVVELMADLPDKVDFRWMARWGIMEHLSKLGVGMVTAIDEVVEKMKSARGVETVSERVTPEISLDVLLLARFLEARGVHPYFAAIAAVAEMHTALTDEMTLLRTGFLELYRTGLVDLNTTEKLMSGLFTIKFTTGYIDPSTARAVTFNYMKPVFWLPAERRLLQLRAAMDRVYEIWRSMLREVSYGVIRLGIKVEEAVSLIKRYGNVAASVLSRHVKSITGVDWSPSIDEEYVDLWIEYGNLLRTVEVRTWVRHYITRIMAWIIYRSSYGWVKEEDFRQLVEKVVEAGWLTKEEGEFFTLIFPLIVGMVKRESIPTALTLATMAEYMVIDDSVINRVFEDQRIVEEYRDLYRKYIAVKPFKSDFKTLLNRARRALIVGAISEEEWSNLTNQAVARYGFREEEIRIQEMLAEIEERMMDVKEYLPTPSTIATLSEYLDIPRQLVEGVLKKRRVPEEWASLWLKYIEVKPVKSDFKAVINTALKALRYNAISKDQFDSMLKSAIAYGFTQREIELVQMRAELELLIDEAREARRAWMPSILTVIAMAEHVPEAVKLLQYYNVDPRVAQLIERYAHVKPLADEARALISALYRAKRYISVTKELEDKVLSIAKQLGVTDAELSLRELALELQVLVDESKVWTPTPSTLATLSEYMVMPTELIKRALEARRIPSEWIGIWLQYISVRPLKSDFKTLLNRARRALVLGAITREEWERYKGEALAKYGFRETEIEIQEALADLEERIASSREYAPTPPTLATLSEYLVVPRELVEEALRARGVPEAWRSLWSRYISVRPLKSDYRAVLNTALKALRYDAITKELWESLLRNAEAYGFTTAEVSLLQLRAELELLVDEARMWRPSLLTLISMVEYVPEAVELLKHYRVDPAFISVVERYAHVKPLADEARALISALYRAKRYISVTKELEDKVLSIAKQLGVTDAELSLRELALELQVLVDESKVWTPTPSTLATLSEYMVLPAELVRKSLEARRIPSEWIGIWLQYIAVRPLKSDFKTLLNRARRALIVGAISEEEWSNLTNQAVARYGFREEEIRIQEMLAEIEERIASSREYAPTPPTLATLSEYLVVPRELVEEALRARGVPEAWRSLWSRYISVRPLKSDYRAVLSTALRALRYRAIPEELWRKILEDAKKFGFTDPEISLIQMRADLELVIEDAREYVPTPSALASMAEYLPEVRDYIKIVLDARRVRGVWAELWTKYIYLRPVVDEVRRWVSAVFELAERVIISVEQLKPVFDVLRTYGWEELEIEIAERTVLASAARRAWTELLGSARQLAAMARYSPAAADMAWTRVIRLVDLLPVDDSTKRLIKEMWKTYIVHYQNYPEIRSYISELVSAYAYGVIDDKTLDKELSMLKDLGVPDTTLSLVKRRAQLRRVRYTIR